MKTILATLAAALALASAVGAQTLNVSANVTLSSGLYNYDYLFSLTGPSTAAPAVSILYLTSDDLSPLDVTFAKNGAATAAWSFVGDDSAGNNLDFFSSSDSLTNGDTLEVKFTDSDQLFRPLTSPTNSATSADSSTNTYSTVSNIVAPAAVPETSTAPLLILGGLGIGFAAYRRRRA